MAEATDMLLESTQQQFEERLLDYVGLALDDVSLCNSSTQRQGMFICHHCPCALVAENADEIVGLKAISSMPLDELNINGE